MFPHISDLINYLFGTHIMLPVQSYGLMLATAFVIAAFVLHHELKRLENENKIHALEKKSVKGAPAGITEMIMSGISGFLVGWKGGGIVFDYPAFSSNPQEFIQIGRAHV